MTNIFSQEIRLAQEPFPLFPGEVLKSPPQLLKVVPANSALRLKSIFDFEDVGGVKRVAGDEYLFEGPGEFSYLITINFSICRCVFLAPLDFMLRRFSCDSNPVQI